MFGFFNVPGFSNPRYFLYKVTCPRCEWAEIYRLKGNLEPQWDEIGELTEFTEVEALPKNCPKCGYKVAKQKFRLPLYC